MPADQDHTASRGDPAETTLPVHRLVFFTDAVIAIAITLLALPLVDLVADAANAHEAAVDVVTHNLVPIGSFLLSFFILCRIWSVHHDVFAHTETVSGAVVKIDLVWLACVVVLPLTAEMVGSYGADPFVLALYVGVLLTSSLALAVMAVALHRADPDRTDAVRSARSTATVEQVLGNAACLAIAFIVVLLVPGLGFWPLLLLLLDAPAVAAARRLTRHRRPDATDHAATR